ncbi:hypothetical protein AB1388_43365, partial [Streptomyces hydrogenans]|uniref:hypothetical protein n=1 Tax=Streptomyces hydrogenans TaxID=1873719 RepID=UPI00345D0CD6
ASTPRPRTTIRNGTEGTKPLPPLFSVVIPLEPFPSYPHLVEQGRSSATGGPPTSAERARTRPP